MKRLVILLSATLAFGVAAETIVEQRVELISAVVNEVAWEAIESSAKEIVQQTILNSSKAASIAEEYSRIVKLIESGDKDIARMMASRGVGFSSGAEYRSYAYGQIDVWKKISTTLKQSAEDLKKIPAKDAEKGAKWLSANLAIYKNLYDNFQLFKNSSEMAARYPEFDLKASPEEYYAISGNNILAFGAVNAVQYLTNIVLPKVSGGAVGIGLGVLLTPNKMGLSDYDLMPSNKSDLREWVKYMAARSQEYTQRGIPEWLKNGTAKGNDVPGGLLQYWQVVYALNPSADMAWVKNWSIEERNGVLHKQWIGVAPITSSSCPKQNFICGPVLGNIISGINQGANSHFGSANIFAGWNNAVLNAAPEQNQVLASTNNNNAQQLSGVQQTAQAINTTAFKASDWVVVEGDASKHYSFGNSFGPISAANNGPIAALNNADVQQTTMQKVVEIPTGVKQVTVGMMANFVTNEYPKYVGSKYNDSAIVEIRTGSGNTYQATLFNKELNSANFQAVGSLPAPLAATGGQTGFESISKMIPVANGGQLVITVKSINVGDTAYPSAILVNSTNVK